MDIILPPACAACGVRLSVDREGHFCNKCTSGIRLLQTPFCRICGIEVSGAGDYNPLCGECLNSPPPFAIARSIVQFGPQVQQLIHKLKYGGDFSVIPGVSELISGYTLREFADIDCVTVVPLHLLRLRQRGLNQAAVLARLFFADRKKLIKPDLLIRTRNTPPQTELGRFARRTNLKGAFEARDNTDLQDAKICLVDDVMTTGTTVKECSRVIMANGAAEVKVLTLARVNAPHRGRHLSS